MIDSQQMSTVDILLCSAEPAFTGTLFNGKKNYNAPTLF